MKTDIIAVEGMSCAHCEIAVQDAARKLPGVAKAKASRRKKQLTVSYDESQASLADIVAAVNATGYEAAATH